MIEGGIAQSAQWCDTRDMTAYGHTKGSIDRELFLQAMAGTQPVKRELKRHVPYRPGQTKTDRTGLD